MNYKKSVTRATILFNKTLGEQIGEQIGGEQITVVLPWVYNSILNAYKGTWYLHLYTLNILYAII